MGAGSSLEFFIHILGYLVTIASMSSPRLQASPPLRLCATFLHLNLFVVLGISFTQQASNHTYGIAPQGPALRRE